MDLRVLVLEDDGRADAGLGSTGGRVAVDRIGGCRGVEAEERLECALGARALLCREHHDRSALSTDLAPVGVGAVVDALQLCLGQRSHRRGRGRRLCDRRVVEPRNAIFGEGHEVEALQIGRGQCTRATGVALVVRHVDRDATRGGAGAVGTLVLELLNAVGGAERLLLDRDVVERVLGNRVRHARLGCLLPPGAAVVQRLGCRRRRERHELLATRRRVEQSVHVLHHEKGRARTATDHGGVGRTGQRGTGRHRKRTESQCARGQGSPDPQRPTDTLLLGKAADVSAVRFTVGCATRIADVYALRKQSHARGPFVCFDPRRRGHAVSRRHARVPVEGTLSQVRR